MYYYLYKITNTTNQKIYIGTHKTKTLDDGYMGSGVVLRKAYKKHGIENFEKTILCFFETEKEMFNKEAEIVNEAFIADKNTYNIKLGGAGGWSYVNTQGKNKNYNWTEYHKTEKYTESRKRGYQNGIGRDGFIRTHPFKGGEFAGKTHSTETKKIIGEKNSEHQAGSGNSQYGTVWIHNVELSQSKKIKKGEPLPEGWLVGRVINFEELKTEKEKIEHKPIEVKQEKIDRYSLYKDWHNLYICVGFEEFVKQTGYNKSHPNLVQCFKRNIPEFKPQNGRKRG